MHWVYRIVMYVSVFAIYHYFTERKSLWIKELIGCMLQKTKLSMFKFFFFPFWFSFKEHLKVWSCHFEVGSITKIRKQKVLTFVFSLETFSYRHNLIMIILLLC